MCLFVSRGVIILLQVKYICIVCARGENTTEGLPENRPIGSESQGKPVLFERRAHFALHFPIRDFVLLVLSISISLQIFRFMKPGFNK